MDDSAWLVGWVGGWMNVGTKSFSIHSSHQKLSAHHLVLMLCPIFKFKFKSTAWLLYLFTPKFVRAPGPVWDSRWARCMNTLFPDQDALCSCRCWQLLLPIGAAVCELTRIKHKIWWLEMTRSNYSYWKRINTLWHHLYENHLNLFPAPWIIAALASTSQQSQIWAQKWLRILAYLD